MICLFISCHEIIPDFIQKFKILLINTKRNYFPYEINEYYYLFKIFEPFIDCINDECKFSYYFGDKKEKYAELLNKNLQVMRKINEKTYSLSLINIEIFVDMIGINNIKLIE